MTPVLFRVEAEGNVLAVFPTLPSDTAGRMMTCYAHVGQHSGAALSYVQQKTRPAKPDEYAALKRELEAKPYEYKLHVVKRVSRKMREAFTSELRR